ncbi:restriction endonuclease subunit S [Hyunsoonleella pacifica]|uniref:Restriction endonuclease subunit S n=1 Tax=Hyunsoonleella pacifica TaxID=1080224 RepID=A0A4Q9FPJ3_9FLAO|nr:restriction endonuclease subunit S [Hyunsoonleella pacifica]TBN17385.1 restriction endonuclease subunit S [Hyunsoonleella pacifica]GGD12421.1 hypothetical protein GCM10011368_13020 [Hyunsoonleella pacifica]
MSEVKQVPKLRFKEFLDEWKVNPFKNLVKISQGLQISISDRLTQQEKGSLFYITNEFLREKSEKKYFIKDAPKSVICDEDDILMTRTGNTGKVVTNVEGAFHNNFFKIAYPKNINKNFLVNYLNLYKTQNRILRLAGTSTIPDLNHSDFYKINFVFPTFEEQQKIAKFLSSVDKKIEQLQQKKSGLEQYKKGVMQQLFSQKLRFKDDSGNDYPEWDKKKLGEVLKIGSGKDYKHLREGEIPVYGTGGLMTYVNDFLFDGESVGIGRKGTIDKPVFLKGKFWTVDTLFYTHSFNEVLPKFIYFLFLLINWKKYNEASGVPSLSKATIENIDVSIPSIQEQTKIANFLSAIDAKIQLVTTQIEQTQQFKKGLLQQMFM